MKKFVTSLLAAALFAGAVSAMAAEPAMFHFGVCTGRVSQT